MIESRKLLVNKIMCPDGTVLQSLHRYDFVEHTTSDGDYYFIDGGLEYQRYGGTHLDKVVNLAIYDTDPHTTIREEVVWGNRYDKDKNLLPKTRWIKIKDLTNDHLAGIYHHVEVGTYSKIMLDEINYRGLNLEDF